MRYARPRQLKTKRGLLKAQQNAWCLSCHEPMARHGKNFTCSPCHVATRIQIGNGLAKRGEAIRNGAQQTADRQPEYPYCVKCQIKMHRFSRNSSGKVHAFRCAKCKAMTSSHTVRGKVHEREQEIADLVRAGYLDCQIVRKMKCHHTTVRRLRAEVTDARLCECGQLFYHTTKCHLRAGWQSKVRHRRDAFEDLLVKINRRVPAAFPQEMRDEICQEMLLEIVKSMDRVLANAPDFIKKYKQRYPFQYHSFDADPKLVERIAG